MKPSSLIQEFLTGLTRVAPLELEIRDPAGQVVMTTMSGPQSAAAATPETVNACRVPIENNGSPGSSLVAYPLDHQQFLAGSRFAANQGPEALRDDFLKPVAGLIQDSLTVQQESEKLVEELSESFEMVHLYSLIQRQVKTLHFSSSKMHHLLEELQAAMRSDLAFALFSEQPEYSTVVNGNTPTANGQSHEGFVRELVRGIPADGAFSDRGYFVVNNSREINAFRALHPRAYRFLAVPIRHAETVIGYMGMVSFNMQEIFRRGEMRMLMAMGEQVDLVISNTNLFRNLESFLVNLVRSFVQAIEAKDTYTRGHSERVNELSLLMADEIGLDAESRKTLDWASILHDVGKIGIPESILNKPGKLDDEEYNTIKGHPEKGYQILKHIDQLDKALPGILHHHERYDGRGYPQGLAGEDISLAGRIIAIADTFDAISSSRAYRAAKSQEKALVIVREVAGSQLDPDLVKVFETVYQKHLAAGEEPHVERSTAKAAG